jgi:hypothetical protein
VLLGDAFQQIGLDLDLNEYGASFSDSFCRRLKVISLNDLPELDSVGLSPSSRIDLTTSSSFSDQVIYDFYRVLSQIQWQIVQRRFPSDKPVDKGSKTGSEKTYGL